MKIASFSNFVPNGVDQPELNAGPLVGTMMPRPSDQYYQNTMFWTYDTHNPDLIPNNTIPTPPPPPPVVPYLVDQPYLVYNKNGEFVGFSWYYGESVNISFNYNPTFPLVLPNGATVPFCKYI